MTDWFESRFREPVDPGRLDPAFVAQMRALVVDEWEEESETTPPAEFEPDDREGDFVMLETKDHPTDHTSATPGRRSPGRWLLVAAAAVVIAVVGTLAVVAVGDDEREIGTAAPPPTTALMQDVMDLPGDAGLMVGRQYFVDPDDDAATPLRVTYQVGVEGWKQWFGAIKPVPGDAGFTSLSITTVPNLVTDGCRDHAALAPPVGPSVDDLSTALSRLAPFEVTAPPTDVSLLGYSGKHLAMKVPPLTETAGVENYHDFADCVDGELHSWISTHNDGSFYGYDGPGQTEEFWILDVEGTRLVLVKSDSSQSSAKDIAERDAIFDSIRIEP